MPDEYRISDLTSAEAQTLSNLNNTDLMEVSQVNTLSETGYASVKTTIANIALHVANVTQFASELHTSDKKIVGAINSLLANFAIAYADLTFPVSAGTCCIYGGLIYQANQNISTSEAWDSTHWDEIKATDVGGSASIMMGTSAPTSQQGDDGNLYVQYTAGTGGANDTVDAIYVKLDGAWCEISTGGGSGGGHTIVDDSGTSLTQRSNLQFKGAYSEDNSTDGITEVNVIRSMTKAEFALLSDDEKIGLINITDEISASGDYVFETIWDYVNNNSGTVPFGTYTVTLAESIDKYDGLFMLFKSSSSDSGDWANPSVFYTDVNVIKDNPFHANYFNYTSFADRSSAFYLSGTTLQKIIDNKADTNGLIAVYGIKYGGKSNVDYSTNEKAIGTWIDGSTIYEKTFIAQVTSTAYTIDVSNLNIDKVISNTAFIEQTSGNVVTAPYATSNTDYGISYYNSNLIKFSYAGAYNTTTWYVTIRYTKLSS